MLNAKKTEWDLSPLGSNPDDSKFASERKSIELQVKKFVRNWKNRKDYLQKPAALLKALDEYEKLTAKYGLGGNEHYYFWLRTMQDQNDPMLKAKYNQIDEFAKNLSNEIQFFGLRVAQISPKTQKALLKYKPLGKYHHYLATSFDAAKHLLSEPEEKIMTLKSRSSFEQWVEMVSGMLSKEEREALDEKGEKKKYAFGELRKLVEHKNKEVRDGAVIAFNDVLDRWKEVAEQEINAILADKKVNDGLRKFDRPDAARHLDDDVDAETVDALLESVEKRFDIPQRYYTLKAALFGQKKLAYHERNVEYGELTKSYDYQETVDMVYKVFSQLDSKFAEILKMFVEEGHIDAFPKKGKWDNAFSVYQRIDQPTYILLNHLNRLEDVLTLAHEAGHGINNELMREKQHSLYFSTPKSTAEVASTFMEDFVLQELLKEANDELRLAIMVKKLNDDVSTIFRQVACYRFEQEMHSEFRKKGYLSHEDIGKIFLKHMASYMGPAVEQSPGCQNWWIYWGHIRDFFYVYSYASGLLISKSMQNAVKRDPAFISKVKEFLSSGTSESPKNVFAKMDIDITKKSFWEKGISEIENLLMETEAIAKRMGKI